MKRIIFFVTFLVSCVFANELQDIRDRGVVKIGVYDSQPPFAKFEDRKFQGFEIDIAKKIARNIFKNGDGDVEFVAIRHVDKVPFLENGKIDMVVANYTITKEREKVVDFSMPYFAVNVGLLTRVNDKIRDIKNLRDKTILLKKGTTTEKYFSDLGYKIRYCTDAESCYKALKNHKGDAYAADNVVVMAFAVADKSVEANIITLGKTDYIGIAVKEGSKELLDFVNQQLISLSKEGFFKKIFDDFIDPFYKGTADKKYFLLDDIYSMFG